MICEDCAWEADGQVEYGRPLGPESISGHNACKGCFCQHKPVKDGQVVREAQ